MSKKKRYQALLNKRIEGRIGLRAFYEEANELGVTAAQADADLADAAKGGRPMSGKKATKQYRSAHSLIFFTEHHPDLNLCSGEEVRVPGDSLLTVIGGRPERPVCKTQVSGRTVYGYVCPESHEAVGEQAELNGF